MVFYMWTIGVNVFLMVFYNQFTEEDAYLLWPLSERKAAEMEKRKNNLKI